jgi:hypothetical protein
MGNDPKFSLASAVAAAKEDMLPLWVGDFLASRGSDNEILAGALAQDPHWWAGPLKLQLDDLIRLAGPEDEEVLVPIEEKEWEGDVEEMESSLEEGWDPPPLIAEYQDGRLLLQDGNHRYEALTRAGQEDAWVIVMFASEDDREAFLKGAH